MQKLNSSWSDTIAKIDIHSGFKQNRLTIKRDGSEDHLVSSRLKALIWDEMKDFCTQLLNSPHPATIKKLEEEMIPPEGVTRKFSRVVDGILPDERYEILGREPTDDEWDSDVNESEDETNNTEQLSNTQISDNECTSVNPEVEVDFACLSIIESVVSMEKKQSSDNLLPFFIKIENALCKERQRCQDREKRKRKQQTQVASQSNNVDTSSSERELHDHNLIDIFNGVTISSC